MKKRRLVSMALVFALILSLVPVSGFAAEIVPAETADTAVEADVSQEALEAEDIYAGQEEAYVEASDADAATVEGAEASDEASGADVDAAAAQDVAAGEAVLGEDADAQGAEASDESTGADIDAAAAQDVAAGEAVLGEDADAQGADLVASPAEEAVETPALAEEEAQETETYVLMNIPYSVFYSDIIGVSGGFDAVTTATAKNKATIFWDSSVKGNMPVAYGEGTTIKGVQFPVLISDADLAKLAAVDDSAQAYYIQSRDIATPAVYAAATVADDGTITFGAAQTTNDVVLSNAKVTVDNTTKKHGQFLLSVSEDDGALTGADKASFQVYGAVMTDAAGNQYALYHLFNLYYKDFHEIAFNTTDDSTGKGQDWSAYKAYYAALEKGTVTDITFYTTAGVYTIHNADAYIASPAYVLMNIPYADFYAAEGIEGVDAVTTATVKTYNQNMAAGSYHAGYINEDPKTNGATISGVTYPVYVEDIRALEGLTEVTDADTADITVAVSKSAVGNKEVSGKDLLFASGDYAYYVLSDVPANYKTLSGSAGSFSFSAVKNGAEARTLTSAQIKYGGHHTPVELDLEADEIAGDTVVTGITVTAGGRAYALRHVENIWKKVDLGWFWTDLDGAGLGGQTITNITYYTQDGGVYSYDVALPVKKNPGTAFAASFEDTGATVKVDGLPEDIENARVTVSTIVGRGETPVVLTDAAALTDGKAAMTEAAASGTAYNVNVTSDNYADLSVQCGFETMAPVAIGGINYYYTDVAGDIAAMDYQAVVSRRGGSTTYHFTAADLTKVGETDYAYALVAGATPLSGTLYGYGQGTATNYREVYAGLGVATDTDAAYDAVTSATGFTGHHAKDIPSLVAFGTDAEGNKAITGLSLGREKKTVDAAAYVEASILKAAGEAITSDQEDILSVTLKPNPMDAPAAAEVAVTANTATFTMDKYGSPSFLIYPDDTAEGYVWSEYWNSVYAATISDGTSQAGAVHWVDIYGEAAASGYHYNKLEFSLNKGTSPASNGASVSRYDAFFDESGQIKAGTYTIRVYAEGYSTLTAQVKVGYTLADKAASYTGEGIAIDPVGDVAATYTYYSDAACTTALEGLPVEPGTYYVKAELSGMFTSNVAKLTINKLASRVTLKAKTATYTGKAIAIGAATVTGSAGKVTYAYYTDAACTKKAAAHANAGTYYVKATVAADDHYSAATSAAAKLVIKKAASTITLKAKSATYTGKAISVAKATVKGSAGKVTYAYYSDAKCTRKVTKHVNAGTYYVKATVAANANYKAATSKAVKLVIKKKAQTVTVSTLKKTYTAKALKSKAQTFAIGAKASGKGKLTYKKASGSKNLTVNAKTGKITVKKGTKKGAYTIKVKITAAANTNFSAKTVTKTIKVTVK